MPLYLKRIPGIALFLALIAISNLPAIAQQDRSEGPSSQLQLFVTVTNSKGFVTGLGQDSFQVFVDKEPARIVRFNGSGPAASIGILVDFSGSMPRLGSKGSAEDKLSVLQKSLEKFFNLADKSNDYFLVGIRNRPELLVDWTSDHTAIVKNMRGIQPRGGTALFDASYLAINKLEHGRHAKRALILISDGNDNNSRYSFNDLLKLIRESGVLLYSLNVQSPESAGTALHFDGIAILQELTSTSGGLGYAPGTLNQSDADQVFQAIAAELTSQYTLGIETFSQLADSKFHKIKVKVNSPSNASREMKNLKVRTREGYFTNP